MSRSDRHSERGAIIIQVAVALLGLTVFSAFVLDYGVLWASRGQAQNSADAGAHSAAVHLMFNPTDTSGAVDAARRFANANTVWGEFPQTPEIVVQTGLTCPPGTGGGTGCVRVQVNRGTTDLNNVAHTNVLPTFFAKLAGVNSQSISALAMAQIASGNSVTCIKPWAVADKWQDTTPDTDPTPYADDSWDRDDTFLEGTDSYNAALGFNPHHDTGYQMPLKPGDVSGGAGSHTWSSGWAMELDFGNGGAAYEDEIKGCLSDIPVVGIFNLPGYSAAHAGETCSAQNDDYDPGRGCLKIQTGMTQGPTQHGVDALVAQDAGAVWVSPGDVGYDSSKDAPDHLGYVNSPCMNAGTCQTPLGQPQELSPRIVPIAIFDALSYAQSGCSGSGCRARVTNMAGFFVEGMCDEVYPVAASRPSWCGSPSDAQKTVIGRFMRYPGQFSGEAGDTTSAFAQMVRLVR